MSERLQLFHFLSQVVFFPLSLLSFSSLSLSLFFFLPPYPKIFAPINAWKGKRHRCVLVPVKFRPLSLSLYFLQPNHQLPLFLFLSSLSSFFSLFFLSFHFSPTVKIFSQSFFIFLSHFLFKKFQTTPFSSSLIFTFFFLSLLSFSFSLQTKRERRRKKEKERKQFLSESLRGLSKSGI